MALKDYEVMSVAFMITEKQVLAVGGINLLPIFKS
jgi:hypothetical protein